MSTILRHTPLYKAHVQLGGRMVPFAGWEMPIQFGGILSEARSVRSKSGGFDVSNMARFSVDGRDARALLSWVHTADNNESTEIGRARYGFLCNEQGGIIDDGIVYRLGDERFLLVTNAANARVVLAWLIQWQHARFPRSTIADLTEHLAMIAVQGPESLRIVEALFGFDAASVGRFRCTEFSVSGREVLIGRTGYTGEQGVEVITAAEHAAWFWDLFLSHGVTPCGLGARDVLRLEAGLLLHGSDISQEIGPIEAGMERFVAKEADFCGKAAIQQVQAIGPCRRLVGFQTLSRGALPRSHMPLRANGIIVGQVTSGGYSPTLDRNIGLGYVPVRFASPNSPLQLDVRGKLIDAVTVSLPFYSH